MPVLLPDEQRPLFKTMVEATVRIFNPKSEAIGTGVFISDRGLILTCQHVIKQQKTVIVRTCVLGVDWKITLLGRNIADVIFTDRKADLAVLLTRKVPSHFSVAEINFEPPPIEESAYRVGMDSIPMDSGHIFKHGKDGGIPYIAASMNTDDGASGGPLFDEELRLVGIVTKCSSQKEFAPIAYAVPMRTVRNRIFRRKTVKVHLPEDIRPER